MFSFSRPISAEPKKKVTFADTANVREIKSERQNVYKKKLLEQANSGVLLKDGSQNALGWSIAKHSHFDFFHSEGHMIRNN